MTKIEERITNSIQENGVLIEFLGAENVERLKREVTNAIIQQVIEDLESSCDYIINTDDIVQDIIDDVKDKIKPEIEKLLYKKTMSKLKF